MWFLGPRPRIWHTEDRHRCQRGARRREVWRRGFSSELGYWSMVILMSGPGSAVCCGTRRRLSAPCAAYCPYWRRAARRSVAGCDWRDLDTRQHHRPAYLRCHGVPVPEGWVITRIVRVGYLPVSRCYGGCRSVSRGSGPLAASSRKSQVGGYLRVHGWMTPAYRPARRTRTPVTWAFAPTGQHQVSAMQSRLRLPQVSASQHPHGVLGAYRVVLFATFRYRPSSPQRVYFRHRS